MDLEFIEDKIKEWDTVKQNSRTMTICTLMDQMIDSGKKIMTDYKKILNLHDASASKGRMLVSDLNEVIKNDNMDKYHELINFDVEKFNQLGKTQFERQAETLRNDPKVIEIVDSFKDKSIDEIIQLYDNILSSADEFNKKSHVRLLESLSVIKSSFELLLTSDELLVMCYKNLINAALDYHDYGKWSEIKKEAEGAITSLHPLTDLVAKIAKIINIFDKEKNKENFYTTTEDNVSKMEGQLVALLFVANMGGVLAEYLLEDKYNMVTMDEKDYKKVLDSIYANK